MWSFACGWPPWLYLVVLAAVHTACMHWHTSWPLGASGRSCMYFVVWCSFCVFWCVAWGLGALFPLLLSHNLLVSYRPRPMRAGNDNGCAPCWRWRCGCFVCLVRCVPQLPFYVRYRSVTFNILVSAAGIFSWSVLHAVLLFGVSFQCPGAHTSPAPIACTLLSVSGHTTFSFAVFAALVFVVLCECRTILDLGEQRLKLFTGFLRPEKTIFPFIFAGGASFSWFSHFSLLRSCATTRAPLQGFPKQTQGISTSVGKRGTFSGSRGRL